MAGFAAEREALEALGVRVVAASVDTEEQAREVTAGLPFPVAYGMTRADADRVGAFWEERRGFVQPSEFLVRGRDARILSSTYSSSPIGRVEARDVVSLVKIIEARSAAARPG